MSHEQFHRASGRLWSARLCAIWLLLAFPALAAAGDTSTKPKPSPAAKPTSQARVVAAYGKLPLSFEANQGQADSRVKFLSRGRGYGLFLTGEEAVLVLRSCQSSVVGRQLPPTTNHGQRTTDALNPKSQIQNPKLDAPSVLRLRLMGANPAAEVTGLDELPGKSNYFLGNDPKKWRTNVPNYAKVAYKDVYPGVDLVYYGNQGQLEYDFVVAAGADPRAIRLGIETGNWKLETGNSKIENGQSSVVSGQLSVAQNGDLVIATEGGEVRFHKPVVYQIKSAVSSQQSAAAGGWLRAATDNGQLTTDSREYLDAHYTLRRANPKSKIENPKYEVAFEISKYDPRLPLIIDPVLSYSTYLGGTDYEELDGIVVDSSGEAYLAGLTFSADFPTQGPLQPAFGGGRDAVVSKINSLGSALVYSTYLGGSGNDYSFTLTVDPSGNAYVGGTTDSTDFPTVNPFQAANGGMADAFVAKLDATGSVLLYSTYLGGTADEQGWGIAADAVGNAYVTGWTGSSDFPTNSGAYNPVFGGVEDGFVTQLDTTSAGSPSLVYSTFLGGTGQDNATSIARDGSANVYVTGFTYSSDFPTSVGAYQSACTSCGSNIGDAFVAKLNPALSGSAGLVYSTFLGGSGYDIGRAITSDNGNNAYVAIYANSSDFPTTPGAFRPSFSGGYSDAVVAKLDTNAFGAASLVYSTYLGGSSTGEDVPWAIAVDTSGNAYVAGETPSTDFPVVSPIQATRDGGVCTNPGGCTDIFITKLNASGSAIIFSTYLGGSDSEGGYGIALDPSANAYVTGLTSSTNFQTTGGAFQTTYRGGGDGFVVKLSGLALPVASLSPTALDLGSLGVGFTSAPQTVTLTNAGDATLIFTSFNVQVSLDPPVVLSPDFTQSNNCGASLAPGASCTLTVLFAPSAIGTRNAFLVVSDNAAGSPHWVSLTGVGLAAPAVSLSPGSLNFGFQTVGLTSAAQPVTLTNTGTAALTISSITAPADFAQTNDCGTLPAVLGTGGSCTINVTFTPSAEGFVIDFLSIEDNAPGGSPRQVTLFGTGTAYPVPQINQPIVPAREVPGGAGFTLTVNGTGFFPNSVVKWNGSARATAYVSGTQLTATIPASDIATAGTAWVTVVNPAPGGGVSNAAFFHITAPTSSVSLARTDLPVGTSPHGVTAADLNGDGILDLAVANNNSNTVSVLLGNGNGSFRVDVEYAAGIEPYAVTTGDFNGDGVLDLALPNFNAAGPGSVSVLLGDGDGTFQSPLNSPAGSASVGVATGDFDMDGKLDLAVTNLAFTSSLSILLGNGDGTFQAHVDYDAGIFPFSVAPGDVNGDGYLDLILAISGTGSGSTTSVMLGNGDGTFQAATSFTVGLSPGGMVTADLNGDRWLDVAVTNSGANTVSILLGNGDGSFHPHVDYATGIAPFGVVAGDWNADGAVDLVVSNQSSNTVSLLLGNGGGTFQAGVHYPVGPNPMYIAPGDFSGDGRLDLAVSNANSTLVSVLLQAPVPGVSPAELVFGDQVVDTTSAPQTVTLTNTGSAELNVSGIAFTGANGADFSQTNTCGAGVDPGANCTIDVTFTPTAVGARAANLTITTNAAGSPHVVDLSGNGTTAGLIVTLDPTSLVFGSQRVGTASAPQAVTYGLFAGTTLNVTSIVASGNFAQTNNCPASMSAGSSCTINVTFTPTATGARVGSITITDDAPGSPRVVSLSGTGIVGPVVSLSPSSVEFLRHPLNIVDCPAIDVTLSNTGDAPLAITGIAVSANFAKTHTCGAGLAAGANCKISVKFSPPGLGTTLGTLTITSDAPGSPHTVPLSGTGTVACRLLTSARSATVLRGTDSASFGVTDSSPSCSAVPIELSCSLQNPAACALDPATIQPSGGSTLKVSNLRSVAAEWVTVVVNAVGEFRWASDSFTVLISDFAFTRAPERSTVRAGESTSYALAIRPVNGLAGAVRLGCSGAPQGATCTVTPSAIELDGSSLGQATVRVTTTARALAPGTRPSPPGHGMPKGLPLLLGMTSLAILATLTAQRRRTWLALSFSLLLALAWAACGGGGAGTNQPTVGTPPGTYMLTITGTYTSPSGADALVHETSVDLTVN